MICGDFFRGVDVFGDEFENFDDFLLGSLFRLKLNF
jgi:hypothetical protein